MATVSLVCFVNSGLILTDPAGLVPPATLRGPCNYPAGGAPGGVFLQPETSGAGAVTSGIDQGLWTRFAAANPSLVPSAVALASTP